MSPIIYEDKEPKINKTRSDMEDLKQSWIKDPCWDIEDTEGFEFFRAELKAFRITQEAKWEKEREARKNIDYLEKAKDREVLARSDCSFLQALALIAIAEVIFFESWVRPPVIRELGQDEIMRRRGEPELFRV